MAYGNRDKQVFNIERLIIGIKKTFVRFARPARLLLAVVVAFGLFLGMNFPAPLQSGQVFAFFGKSNREQALIVEESLRAQFQGIEERLLREGSYVYNSALPIGRQGYYFPTQLNDFDEGLGSAEFFGNILIQGVAFLSLNNPSPNFINGAGIDRVRSGVIAYKVQPGDIPSYIAASFGISTNTLLWANNLSYWSIIKPGQKLVILPTSGVLHETKKGETIDGIVKKYKGDIEETLAYNGLPADGSLEVSQEIIIPGGRKAIYYQPTIRYAYQPSLGVYGSKSRKFPWGQCTWYVAQKRYVPWGSHAKYWLANARTYGFQTGTEPQPGAIVVTNESWYGHVAYVEAVSGNYVTVSEMHGVPSWMKGKLKTRVLNKKDWRIRGYIY